MTFATQASAFKDNLTAKEYQDLSGVFSVEDLAVGVKALINIYEFCSKDGELLIDGWGKIETDPQDFSSHFQIVLQPNGAFDVTFMPGSRAGGRFDIFHSECDNTGEFKERTMYRINSINGFTDLKSLVEDLKRQGFNIN